MTAPRPTVSVITICLNDAPGLRRTVDSVLAQDHPALEHVIVDGGSRDGTAALLDERRAHISFHRVAYDMLAAAAAVRQAGLPAFDADRLELGQ